MRSICFTLLVLCSAMVTLDRAAAAGTLPLEPADPGLLNSDKEAPVEDWWMKSFSYTPQAAASDRPSANLEGGSASVSFGLRLKSSPNPFVGETTIRFGTNRAEHVDAAVYDGAGRRVCVLLSELVQPGEHITTWRGLDARGVRVASGVYTLRVKTMDGVETHKIVLAR